MIFALFSFAYAASMPIPNRYPGIVYGVDDPLVHLEVYADPLCPVCSIFWPILQQIVDAYPSNLRVTVHFLPLPYHTWSYLITRSIVAVQQISLDKAKTFLTNIYNGDQDQFDLPTKCENDVVKLVASYVEKTLSISQSDFLEQYDKCDSLARIEFKFAASHRVNGTPVCFLNGVESDLGAGTPISTWKSVIDQLIRG